MNKTFLRESMNPVIALQNMSYKMKFSREHPDYFWEDGLLVFCGDQGMGKTLSAVNYVFSLMERYPKALYVSNVELKNLPEGIEVIEYDGLDSLKKINNGENGVVFLIDEIQLEMNSLESKNIDIEVMIEICQQRKQRKHIVATSQVFGRMGKALREQVKDIVLCRCYFGFFQYNKLCDGFTSTEENGKINASVKGKFRWFHKPYMYARYDTYAKMKRYNKEWQGRARREVW